MSQTFQVGSWLDALAAFALDNGFGDFGWVDVGRRSDDASLPSATIVLTEVRGLVAANMGWGGDVAAPYANLYVRGNPDDYEGPRDACWNLTDLLGRLGSGGAVTVHGQQFLAIGGGSQGTPSPLGRDENRRHQFTVDVPVWLPRPVGAVPVVVP